MIYAGPDAQFGKMSATDKQALASYMHQEFSKVLGRRFQPVAQAGPGTLRARLTLTGAEASTPVLSTVSHVFPGGLVVNAGAQAIGGRGTFSGWVSYAVEIEDAETGSLLYAHVASRSANALDITANFRGSTRRGPEYAQRQTSWATNWPAHPDSCGCQLPLSLRPKRPAASWRQNKKTRWAKDCRPHKLTFA